MAEFDMHAPAYNLGRVTSVASRQRFSGKLIRCKMDLHGLTYMPQRTACNLRELGFFAYFGVDLHNLLRHASASTKYVPKHE